MQCVCVLYTGMHLQRTDVDGHWISSVLISETVSDSEAHSSKGTVHYSLQGSVVVYTLGWHLMTLCISIF